MKIESINTIKTLHNSKLKKINQISSQSLVSDALSINFKSLRFKQMFESAKAEPLKKWVFEDGRSFLVDNPNLSKYKNLLVNLSADEKKKFVSEYCEMTGFPSLEKMTENLDKEILGSVLGLAQKFNVKPLFVAYSKISSAGRGLVMPGSDADGSFVLIESRNNPFYNRASIGFDMNQRIIDSTGTHFPELFSLDEMMKAINFVEEKKYELINPTKLEKYERNLYNDGPSFIEAAEFNIDLANKLSHQEKEMILSASFFVELLRSGKILLNELDSVSFEKIKKSILYKYSNLYRQEGLADKLKPKLYNRIEFCNNFKNLNEEEMFQVCNALWENSLGFFDNKISEKCHENFDLGDVLEMYQKLR